MAENDFKYDGEVPSNYEQKCPLILVVDISGSMEGSPLLELNNGLQAFQNEIRGDRVSSSKLEISIITFGSSINEEQDFSLIHDFEMPNLVTDRGSTRMVDGLRKSFEMLEKRKVWYKKTGQQYYRPYVVLITDGYPDTNQDISWLENKIEEGYNNKEFNFWAFGVEQADMELLNKLAHDGSLVQKLKGLEFVKFFKWLSASMTSVSNSRDGDNIDVKPKSEEENPFQIKI